MTTARSTPNVSGQRRSAELGTAASSPDFRLAARGRGRRVARALDPDAPVAAFAEEEA